MKILGIETSCDETAAAIVDNGRTVESSVIFSQIATHQPFGGVVPEVASRQHIKTIIEVVDQALNGRPLKSLDGIAVTQGPGLVGSLLVGIEVAKGLAHASGKPFIGVNHVKAHLYAGWLQDPQPEFPILGLIVSGGHTEIVWWTEHERMELITSTRDDAAGEAFDKIAKLMGCGYPGGPIIERLASQYVPTAEDRRRPLLPVATMKDGSSDLSFSGLKTAAHWALEHDAALSQARLAWHAQHAIVNALCNAVNLALADRHPRTLLVCGGVAANQYLKRAMTELAGRHQVSLIIPPVSLCTDNAAMVAAAGHFQWQANQNSSNNATARPDLGLVESLS